MLQCEELRNGCSAQFRGALILSAGAGAMLSEWEVCVRLVAGAVAGMVIGIDRTRKSKGTGVRTLGLVGLGAAASTAIFDAIGHVDAASRVVQGLITGIGFLGAGVIMKRDSDSFPHGLTTAASVWVTAALGAAAGAGVWTVVGTGVVVGFVLLSIGPQVERLFGGSGDDDAARPAPRESRDGRD
jgi:putative Mg2+ transporter-C (MgtC) family protein